MDPQTQKLMQRTRERRELLAKKMAELSPSRKRNTLCDSQVENIQPSKEVKPENSPKRHCARGDELLVKPDTPAIPSVRSRMKEIALERKQWAAEDNGVNGEPSVSASPVKTQVEATIDAEHIPEQPPTPRTRRSRLAALAKNISSWEDDLSHPQIKKEEPKSKKAWQPPKFESPPVEEPAPSKPPRTYEHTLAVTESSPGLRVSPAKPPRTKSPTPSDSPNLPGSPRRQNAQVSSLTVKLGSTQGQSSPLALIEGKSTRASPAYNTRNSPAKTAITPNKETCKYTPKKRASTEAPGNNVGPSTKSPRQSDVNEPTKKPVSARLAAWQQKTEVEPDKKGDEPTKTPVAARLATWQNKVDAEGQDMCKTPVRRGSPIKRTPAAATVTSSAVRHKSGTSPAKSPAKVNAPVPTARQSTIAERAKGFQSNSPTKGSSTSPKKLAPAARAIQEKLEKLQENWQQNEIAEKIRLQKQADMAVLQNRWQNGVLKEDVSVARESDTVAKPQSKVNNLPTGVVPPPPPLPTAISSPVKSKPANNSVSAASMAVRSPGKKGKRREEARDKLRNDFENKLAAMGFEVEATPEKKVATFDLRPIKAKEAADKAAKERGHSPTKKVTAVSRDVSNDTPKMRAAPTAAATRTPSAVTEPKSATSIYSLIKKQTGATPLATRGNSAQQPDLSTPDVLRRAQPAPSSAKRNSFDSESSYCSETEESQSETGLSRQTSTASSQSAYSQTDSRYSETQDDYTSQTDDASELEDYTTDDPITQTESDDYSDGSGVSDLLDEAMDDTTVTEVTGPVAAPRRKPPARESSSVRRPRPATYHEQSDKNTSQVTFGEDVHCIRRPPASGERSGYRVAQQADKRVTWAAEGSLSSESEVEEKAIIYSIDQYRARRDNNEAATPSQTIVRDSHQHNGQQGQRPAASEKSIRRRLQELQDMVSQEQNVISQTSNALNQCCHSESTFAASQEAVECHRLLLLACKKRECFLSEMSFLRDGGRGHQDQGPVGSLTISDIRLPLKQDVTSRLNSSSGQTIHYFVLLVRHENHLISTQMVSSQDTLVRGSLDIPNLIKFQNIHQSYHVQLDIYSMHITKEPLIQTPKKKTPKKTPKKKGRLMASMQSPGGPTAVRSSEFQLVASLPINFRSLQKTHFNLNGVSFSSPLQGTIHLKLQCLMECQVEERGFLTMFEDVSGFGAWHRRWCALKGHFLSFWKYPDDERIKEPMGYIDLKQCITDSVGLVARDICARPNTFELVTVRRQSRGEADTLVTRCYNTMTTTKHWVSADTKDDRIVWCNQLNAALSNIRAWNPDALRPIRKQSNTNH